MGKDVLFVKVIAAVEDRYGMMFNHRRVSRDRELNARILKKAAGGRIWMNEYSAKLFTDTDHLICVAEDFLDKAAFGEYCFVEDRHLAEYQNRIEEILLCRWNRTYPSDFRLDLIPEKAGMTCVGIEEFQGSSHEKITMERWIF